MSNLLLAITGAFAEFERAIIKERKMVYKGSKNFKLRAAKANKN